MLVQRITDYQLNRLKVVKHDLVIELVGRLFNSLIEDARNENPGIQAEPDKQQLLTKVTCDGGLNMTDADLQNAATQLGNTIAVNIIRAFATVGSGRVSGPTD